MKAIETSGHSGTHELTLVGHNTCHSKDKLHCAESLTWSTQHYYCTHKMDIIVNVEHVKGIY